MTEPIEGYPSNGFRASRVARVIKLIDCGSNHTEIIRRFDKTKILTDRLPGFSMLLNYSAVPTFWEHL